MVAQEAERYVALQRLTSRELLRTYAATLTILLERGIVRTRNAPAGDLAERLVADAYGGTLAPNSAKSHDVLTADGRRLQVKCRVLADPRAQVFSVFRSWDFDACVFVRFDPVTYNVLQGYELPVATVRAMARESAWVKGSRVAVRTPFHQIPGAVDVGAALQRALEHLPDSAPDDDRH